MPQITGVPGFVAFSDKVCIQYLYLYTGLNDVWLWDGAEELPWDHIQMQ